MLRIAEADYTYLVERIIRVKVGKRLGQNETKDMLEAGQPNITIIKFFEGIASDKDNIKLFEGIACRSQPLLSSKRITKECKSLAPAGR